MPRRQWERQLAVAPAQRWESQPTSQQMTGASLDGAPGGSAWGSDQTARCADHFFLGAIVEIPHLGGA